MLFPRLVLIIVLAALSFPSSYHCVKRGSRVQKQGQSFNPLDKVQGSSRSANAVRTLEKYRLESTSGLIKLTFAEFHELVYRTPRKYFSACVLVLQRDNKGCKLCAETLGRFTNVAQAYAYNQRSADPVVWSGSTKPEMFFVLLSVEKWSNKNTMKIDLTVPNIFYFGNSSLKNYNPVSKLVDESGRFDHQRITGTPEIAKWILDVSDVFINLKIRPDEGRVSQNWQTLTLTCLSMIIFTVWRQRGFEWLNHMDQFPDNLPSLNYKYLVVVILVWLSSGQMYNYIRGTAVLAHNYDGSISIITPYQHDQLLVESLIVMILYGIMVHSMIHVIERMEDSKEKDRFNKILNKAIWFKSAFLGLIMVAKLKGM